VIDPPIAGEPTLSAPLPRRSRRQSVDFNRPFARLAVTHGFGMAGEAALALALAGSLFFKVDPSEGRQKVFLGLVLTMAPFALVGPLLGPMVDRVKGGHRAVIIASMAGRVVTAVVMIPAAAAGSLFLFPEAFVMLVLAKTYQVAKAAVVPNVVEGDLELVEANSKLQLIGGLSGFVAIAPAGLALLFGSEWVLVICTLCFAAGTIASFRIPRTRVAVDDPAATELAEAHSPLVVVESTSMAVIRGLVGFVTLLLAFALRGGAGLPPVQNLARNVGAALARHGHVTVLPIPGDLPQWYFAVVVAMAVVGGLIGASLAPRLRRAVAEERILGGSLVLVVAAGVWCAVVGGVAGFGGLSFLVAMAASVGKQAFDSMIQRDAPESNRGRLFARFESRFQVAWVIGAVIPTAIRIPITVGAWMVAVTAAATAVFYVAGGFGQLSRSGKSGISTSSESSGNSTP